MYRYWRTRPLYEEELCAKLPRSSLVVSAGEGTGEYMTALAERFPNLTFVGLDLDPKRIRIARALSANVPNAHFVVSDATKIPMSDGSAGFSFSRNTFHVVPNKDGFLKEMRRTTNGLVYISNIRNNGVSDLLIRVRGLMNRDYESWASPGRSTEKYLRKIGAYKSLLWYRRFIRRYFHDVRVVGTYSLWTDRGRKVSFITTLFSLHYGFIADQRD